MRAVLCTSTQVQGGGGVCLHNVARNKLDNLSVRVAEEVAFLLTFEGTSRVIL